MKDFIIYSVVFGKKCHPRTSVLKDPNYERVLYTDLDCYDENKFYRVKKTHIDCLDSVRKNRRLKILIPEEIFNNYKYSLYLDYKHPMTIDYENLFSGLEFGSDILISKHKNRDCVYDEGRKCIDVGKGEEAEILRQLNFYKKENYPIHNGLYAAYWIFRRHTVALKLNMESWWEQVERFSSRDQISLPYVAWKHNVKISLNRRL